MTVSNAITPVQDTRVFPEQNSNPGDAMAVSDTEQTTTGTIMKLTSPAKVVNMPVAGQPGRYLVGLLPCSRNITARKSYKPFHAGQYGFSEKELENHCFGFTRRLLAWYGDTLVCASTLHFNNSCCHD